MNWTIRFVAVFALHASLSIAAPSFAGPLFAAQGVDLDRYSGVFEAGKGKHIYIQPWPGGEGKLLYSDDDGQVRALSPVGTTNSFSGGPGLLIGSPVELSVSFEVTSSGKVSELRYQWRQSKIRRARKAEKYSAERVTFNNRGLTLGGTIWRPPGKGPHPAMVLIHGSGQTDRYNVLPLVHFLIAHGVALLGYDKRGVGESAGDWRSASVGDLSEDAAAAETFLARQKEIDPKRVGVLGASHGGWVAPTVAAASVDGKPTNPPAFMISVSGPSLSPASLELLRIGDLLNRNGVSDGEIAKAKSLMSLAFDVARGRREWAEYEPMMNESRSSSWFRLVALPRAMDSPIFDHWKSLPLDFDPSRSIVNLRVPTLAVFGELDRTVLPVPNAEEWTRMLKKGGAGDYQVVVFPHANHMMLDAATGGDEEYRALQRFVPNFKTTLIEWLRQRHFAE